MYGELPAAALDQASTLQIFSKAATSPAAHFAILALSAV
jgi:hypothetical protein